MIKVPLYWRGIHYLVCQGARAVLVLSTKVDTRLPEKGNSNSHGARPVHRIIAMIQWTRTSSLSNFPSAPQGALERGSARVPGVPRCASGAGPPGPGFMVQGLGLVVQGLGFRV